jgi:pantoate--beta-alanine ligase
MIIFKTTTGVREYLLAKKKEGRTVGFVPTMGALHCGHLSLVEKAKKENHLVVASIFVNPLQFNDPTDFEKYPVTIEQDISLLEQTGTDILFLPSVKEIYPDGTDKAPYFELGYLETILEGKYRPGHFQGVCNVVHKLLNIVEPAVLYLGQKDLQQCLVIKKLLALIHSETEIIICPTSREPDGLAMSSRNIRLDDAGRKKGSRIFEALLFIKKNLKPGYIDDIRLRAFEYLSEEGFRIDYLEITEKDTLLPVENWNGKTPLVILIAAFLQNVRLIDNMLVIEPV